MTTDVSSLFSMERMKRFATREPFIESVLRPYWNDEAQVRARFDLYLLTAFEPSLLIAYCAANDLEYPMPYVLQIGDESAASHLITYIGVNTIEDAGKAWDMTRSASRMSSRDTPRLLVLDVWAKGKVVAEISYNGRLWLPGMVGKARFDEK